MTFTLRDETFCSSTVDIYHKKSEHDSACKWRDGEGGLTVETEANGDSKSTNERGRPSTKNAFSLCTLNRLICPNRPAIWEGNRPGSPVS